MQNLMNLQADIPQYLQIEENMQILEGQSILYINKELDQIH